MVDDYQRRNSKPDLRLVRGNKAGSMIKDVVFNPGDMDYYDRFLVFTDLADIDSADRGYLLTKCEGIDVNGSRYDLGVGVRETKTRLEGFYAVPILSTCTGDQEGVVEAVIDAFMEHGTPRVLIHTPIEHYPLLFNTCLDIRSGKIFVQGADYETTTMDELLVEPEGEVLIGEVRDLVGRIRRLS